MTELSPSSRPDPLDPPDAPERGAARFEAAADAVVAGDLQALAHALHADPALVHARSPREHHATLLHYVAANGVEAERQRTPPNALDVARLLLDAGAEPNALADAYGTRCTPLELLVSSVHPHVAGVQTALAELLVERGASLATDGTRGRSAVRTALVSGYAHTARALAVHAGRPTELAVAAGLGMLGDVARLLPASDETERQEALVLACMHGHARIVQLLLDVGADPNRYGPEGVHAHSTPLHQAAWGGRLDVVRLLVERGARLDLRDRLYDGTPLDWAEHGQRTAIAEYLRGRGSTEPASAG
jgi:ankyrin repeat protein